MKTKLSLFITLVLTFTMVVLFAISAMAAEDVPRMTKEELKGLFGNPDVIILDVRSGGDWSSSEFKIKGAIRVSPRNWESIVKRYPKDKTLVLYCA